VTGFTVAATDGWEVLKRQEQPASPVVRATAWLVTARFEAVGVRALAGVTEDPIWVPARSAVDSPPRRATSTVALSPVGESLVGEGLVRRGHVVDEDTSESGEAKAA
jgi:hypothetical protein